MTLRELALEILRRIDAGEIDPDATVVRPLCEEHGWVEARYIDQVIRRYSDAQGDPDRRLFESGSATPGDGAATTVKLG